MALTEAQLAELKSKLLDREWRLNNLYRILDKDGKEVQFKMNPAQLKLLRSLHTRNVVLKARQLGMTTFVSIYALDCVLFGGNYTAGTIAHTQEDALKIFDKKIAFAWDRFPQELRELYSVDTNSSQQLKFLRKLGAKQYTSQIWVATSARSQTVNILHVSEMGIMALKFPGKAREVVTGSFNAVPKDGLIIVEATAKGRGGEFYDLVQRAQEVARSGRPLTSLDWKLHFFPWYDEPTYTLDGGAPIGQGLAEYFAGLEAQGIHLADGQRRWYAAQKALLGEEMYSEFPSTPDEPFYVSPEGTYFGSLLAAAYADKRITEVPVDPALPVDTWWDLGMSDETWILFTQRQGSQVRLVDCYHASGEGIPHYRWVLTAKGYNYGTHHAPHDIEVRELGSGKSRRETAQGLGITFRVVPNLPLADGIQAARLTFPRLWVDAERCADFLALIGLYRKDFDDKLGVYKPQPVHDAASHPADAFRYLAVGLREVYNVKQESQPFDPHNPFPDIML